MRIALIVAFFAFLHFALRLTPPADLEPPSAGNAAITPEPSQPETPAPNVAADNAAPSPANADLAEEAPPADAPVRSGEADRPGEERTSVHTAPKTDDIETSLRKELTRLACFTGRPEKRWGPKSRSALRRFVDRAKPKSGNAPSEALLRALRSYPANYCKLCSPGQAACKAGGGPVGRGKG